MSFDLPTPVETVKVGHPALRNGTRNVPQELFGTPALHELIEVMRATLAGKGAGHRGAANCRATTCFFRY
jgi:peptide deformylase